MEDGGRAAGRRRKPPWPTWAVVAVCFGVVASVALGLTVPWLSAGRRAENESRAISALATIAVEQRVFYKEHAVYGAFDELVASGALNKQFSGDSPVVRGYVFRMKVSPRAAASPATFSVNADPVLEDGGGAGGERHFYLSASDGEIRYSVGRPAGPSDPALSAPSNH